MKVKGEGEERMAKPTITLDDVHEDVATWENQKVEKRMKRVVLNRNGQIRAKAREVSDLKIGQFTVGQHVMLAITGDCCYHSKVFAEYVATSIECVERFGGRDRVTFERVEKRPAKEGGAK